MGTGDFAWRVAILVLALLIFGTIIAGLDKIISLLGG